MMADDQQQSHDNQQGAPEQAPDAEVGTQLTETEAQERLAVGMGTGIAIGTGLGVALGIALDNITLGIGIGVAIGLALGAGLGSAKR